MVKVGILGSTGYVGAELVRLLAGHPEAELVFLDSRSYQGQPFSRVYPSLRKVVEENCITVDLDEPDALEAIDLLICALPHGLSQKAVQTGLAKGLKVVDQSADFRISDPKVYEQWYHTPHQEPEILKEAVYGLTEIYRDQIRKARLVANPGCYPTSIILALYPLLKEGMIQTAGIIADSKSGVSGAGRSPGDGNLYAQCNENFKAYGVGSHRHTPEIEQELSKAAGEPVLIQFTPHLVPMNRGILSTLYVKNTQELTRQQVEAIYREYYGTETFIRLLPEGEYPQTKAVSGSNYCDLAFYIDQRTQRLVLVSAIDNLVKGAAGQAIQNMNVMMGFKETMGLEQFPMWP